MAQAHDPLMKLIYMLPCYYHFTQTQLQQMRKLLMYTGTDTRSRKIKIPSCVLLVRLLSWEEKWLHILFYRRITAKCSQRPHYNALRDRIYQTRLCSLNFAMQWTVTGLDSWLLFSSLCCVGNEFLDKIKNKASSLLNKHCDVRSKFLATVKLCWYLQAL